MIGSLLGSGWITDKTTNLTPKITFDDFLKERVDKLYKLISPRSPRKLGRKRFYNVITTSLTQNFCCFSSGDHSKYNFIDKLYLNDHPYDISYERFQNIMDDFHIDVSEHMLQNVDNMVDNMMQIYYIPLDSKEATEIRNAFEHYKQNWAQDLIKIRNSNIKTIFADPKKKRAFITSCLQAEDLYFLDQWSRFPMMSFSKNKESLKYKILEKKYNETNPNINFSELEFVDREASIKDHKIIYSKLKSGTVSLYSKRVSIVKPYDVKDVDNKYFAKSKLLFGNVNYKLSQKEEQICSDVIDSINNYKSTNDIDTFTDSLENIAKNNNDVFLQNDRNNPDYFCCYADYRNDEFFNIKRTRVKLKIFSGVILSAGILGSLVSSWLLEILKNKISNIIEKM